MQIDDETPNVYQRLVSVNEIDEITRATLQFILRYETKTEELPRRSFHGKEKHTAPRIGSQAHSSHAVHAMAASMGRSGYTEPDDARGASCRDQSEEADPTPHEGRRAGTVRYACPQHRP